MPITSNGSSHLWFTVWCQTWRQGSEQMAGLCAVNGTHNNQLKGFGSLKSLL